MKDAILVTVLKTSIALFEERLAELLRSKRASKVLACGVEHLGDTEAVLEPNNYTPALSRFRVTLSWQVAIPDHSLVAHLDLSNGMVTAFGGELTQAEYKRMDGRCELCGCDRDRRHQFLVEDDATKERKVVGGACARKFCGVDLERVVESLDYAKGAITEAFGGEDPEERIWGGGGCSGPRLPFDVRLVLAVAEEVVKRFGWTSRDNATFDRPATAEIVSGWCCSILERNYYKTEKDRAAEAELMAAARALDLGKYEAFVKEELARKWSDLTQSWANALEAGAIDDHGFGRLAYLVVAYGKERAKKQDRSNGVRKAYVPAVGLDKMHDLPGEWTVVGMKEGESDWGYYLGVTAKNTEGYVVWFKSTTKTKGLEIGKTVRLRGKVTGTKDTISFMSHASVKN